MKIPFKYECPLKLKNGNIIHPDFTVLNVRLREQIFWEHRGMLDDRDYCKHAVVRLNDYTKNGIILGKNLIITEEISSVPLGTDIITKTIKNYLL